MLNNSSIYIQVNSYQESDERFGFMTRSATCKSKVLNPTSFKKLERYVYV